VAGAAFAADSVASYLDEQRKLEQLQREFRRWLETKENLVRLADRRDQLLAVLDAKYGYGTDAIDAAEPLLDASQV
jgi:hypothetical protein